MINPAQRARADQVFATVKEAVQIEWDNAMGLLKEGSDPTDLQTTLALSYFATMDHVLSTGMLAWCIVEMARAINEGDWG